MCVPLLPLAIGAMAGATIHGAEQSRKAASQGRQQAKDMAAQDEKSRADADAKAIQSANLRLAADQQRRRGQRGLIARGEESGIDGAAETQPTMIGSQQRRPATPLIRWGR